MHKRLVEIKKQIGKFVANFAVTEENGVKYIYDGDVIREGLEISTYDENGDVVPVADGEYTIQGVKVKIAEGKVIELTEKESKVEEMAEAPESPEAPNELQAKYDELKAKYEALENEYDVLKAEYEQAKAKPMGQPVPQRTEMSAVAPEMPADIKGTRFEKAYRILASN